MPDLFSSMTDEQRQRLQALGWKHTPAGPGFGLHPWAAPDGSYYTEEQALAHLHRLEREAAPVPLPPPGNPGTCKSCGAAIRWVRTVSGKAMPLDPEPCPDGNVVIAGDGAALTLANKVAPLQPGPKYKSHYSTCPDAPRWRKQREVRP